jgi:glycerol-3-phosphate O-acyltransferase
VEPSTDPPEPPARAVRASWVGRGAIAVLRGLLRRWLGVQVLGAEALQTGLDRGQPLVWALPFRQLSALVVLDEQARRLGLPLPLAPLTAAGAEGTSAVVEPHAFFYLTRSGQPSPLASRPYAYAPRLQRLIAAVRADAALDVQVVPVHVFWGRAPRTQSSILKALFAEGWAIPGPLRQAVRLLMHGRQTLLRFGEPVSLRALTVDTDDDALALRRVARLLRHAYRQERERVIGPDLSHRHTLINAVVTAAPVRIAIEAAAAERRITVGQAEAQARRAAWEIASNYSYPWIRAFDLGLQWLWNRLYEGIESHRLQTLSEASDGASVVYVPCHRSHVDYLLLSYLVWHQGLPPPHVAAGANLNLPVVGGILRRGGAFFLRRSFRGDPLYGAVFAEYLHAMIVRGFPIEYFVEGGRSRSGRTLPPKAGLLAMTVESWLRAPQRPLRFVPVYVGYERLIEGESHVAELSGQPKQKESLLGLLRSLRRLHERFGRVHVNAGEPIDLGSFLAARGLRPPVADAAALRAAIGALALEIVARINDAAVVAPVNLVSAAMLGTPRHAMDAGELVVQVGLLRDLAERLPHAARTTLTALPAAEVIAQAERTGLARRIAHPLGDLLQVPDAQVPLLAYFRNNVLHVWALPALLAALLVGHPGIGRARLSAIARRALPFLRAELFLSWDERELETRVQACVDAFEALGVLPGTASAGAPPVLEVLARLLREPLQRWSIVLAVLTGRGAGRLTADALEELCVLLAQRMAFLYDSGPPGFADRAAFRSIVATLGELGWVRAVDGRLHFESALLEAAGDAQWLLPEPVRQAIERITRLSDADLTAAEAASGAARRAA